MASIRERTKANGETTYAVLWRNADDGKQTSLTRGTHAEAAELKRVIEANGNSLEAVAQFYEKTMADGPTVAEVIERHIKHVTGAGPYTVKRYGDYLRLHIKTADIGKYKAKATTRNDMRAWIKWMQARGKAPKTISNVYGLISAAFLNATYDGVIDRNPCAGIKLPKKAKAGDDEAINGTDFVKIRDRIDPHFRPFLEFLLGSGARFSEATALEPGDFKLDAKTPYVRINKAWKQGDDGSWYIGPPKTVKGKRTVSLSPATVASVRPLVDAAAKSGRRVFLMKLGGAMTPQAFYNRAWEKPRRLAGLADKVTVHSIRHLHAAIMLAQGMDIYKLSRRMGHESIQMTVDLYSHLLPDAHWEGAEAAQRALEAVEATALADFAIEASVDDDEEDEVA